jgi:hypothetical protein
MKKQTKTVINETGLSEFEQWRRKRKPKAIRSGNREKDGFLLWEDLTQKEQQQFEDAFLDYTAVEKRQRLLETAGGVASVRWAGQLDVLWRLWDIKRDFERKAKAEKESQQECDAVIAKANSIFCTRLDSINHSVTWAIMRGDWDSIQALAQTGKEIIPEGIQRRLESPEKTPKDMSENLEDSGFLNSAVLLCFFELTGSVDDSLLWACGVCRGPFDPGDKASVALFKSMPRLPDHLRPRSLPTKRRLRTEL